MIEASTVEEAHPVLVIGELREVELCLRTRERDDLGPESLDFPLERLGLRVVVERHERGAESRFEERLAVPDFSEPYALRSLDEYLNATRRYWHQSANDRFGPDIVELRFRRLLNAGVALGDDEDFLFLGRDRRLDGSHRDRSTRRERHAEIGKENGVLQRKQRQHELALVTPFTHKNLPSNRER